MFVSLTVPERQSVDRNLVSVGDVSLDTTFTPPAKPLDPVLDPVAAVEQLNVDFANLSFTPRQYAQNHQLAA